MSSIRDEERKTIWRAEANPELDQRELFPGMMFNVAKEPMESTKLWQIVRRMPKGSLLHCHLGATVDLDWVWNEALATPGMQMSCSVPLSSESVRKTKFILFRYCGTTAPNVPSIWSSEYPPDTLVPITIAADTFPDGGRSGFISWIKDRCSVTQDESLQHHLGVDDVWRKLEMAFTIVGRVIYYEPILRKFMQQLLRTLKEDGVRWLEGRTLFSVPFVLEGSEIPTRGAFELCQALTEEIETFMASEEGKDFWGARFIWTSLRKVDSEALREGRFLRLEHKFSFMLT